MRSATGRATVVRFPLSSAETFCLEISAASASSWPLMLRFPGAHFMSPRRISGSVSWSLAGVIGYLRRAAHVRGQLH